MTEKQILDKLNVIESVLKKSEKTSVAITRISFGLTAMMFSTTFLSVKQNIWYAMLLFVVGVLVISVPIWTIWVRLLWRKLFGHKV